MCYVVYYTCYCIYQFLIRCYYRPTAWHAVADITEFHIDFSFVVYNDRWQPWDAKLKKFMLFYYFSILAFMCVHSRTAKNMFVDTRYKNGKKILYLQTLRVTIRLPDHLVDEFILVFL